MDKGSSILPPQDTRTNARARAPSLSLIKTIMKRMHQTDEAR